MAHSAGALLLLVAVVLAAMAQIAVASNREHDSRVRRVSNHWWGLGKRSRNGELSIYDPFSLISGHFN